MLNEKLFARIDDLMDRRDTLDLTAEERRVLELYHRMFVRAGARLKGADRKRLSELMQRLASLGTTFAQNVLADEKSWEMPLDADDLEGLPGFLVSALAEAAAERKKQGHVLTLSRSVLVPFLQLSPRRELRERAFRAWVARGANGGATDNGDIVARMLRLREERARLLGYESFAAFKLEPSMAKSPAAVRDLLMAVWAPAKAPAETDAIRLAELMREDGVNGALAPWDWRFYAARRQRIELDFDEAETKPYLRLENIADAAFGRRGEAFQAEIRAARRRSLPSRRKRVGGDARWAAHGRFRRRLFRARLEEVRGLVFQLSRTIRARRRGAGRSA